MQEGCGVVDGGRKGRGEGMREERGVDMGGDGRGGELEWRACGGE